VRGSQRQWIPVLDLPLPRPAPAGSEWIDAYSRWALKMSSGARPLKLKRNSLYCGKIQSWTTKRS